MNQVELVKLCCILRHQCGSAFLSQLSTTTSQPFQFVRSRFCKDDFRFAYSIGYSEVT